MAKKTVKKKSDKELMNGLTSEDHLTMSQKGLSDTTTTINTDTVKTDFTSNTRVDNETEPVFTDCPDTAINVDGSVALGNPNPSAKLHIEGAATENAPVTTTTDSGIDDTPSPEINPEVKSEQPEPLTNEELTQLYMQQGLLNNQLIERQYVLEWKIFGKEFKGKYTYLQIDKEMFIFGASVEDIKYVSAETPKDAFAKYLEIS